MVKSHNTQVKQKAGAIPVVATAPLPRAQVVFRKCSDEDGLNKTERGFLAILRLTHPLTHLGIQSITLKLGDDCRYTPDFWTIGPNGEMTFWEVKGFFRDDAKVKIKVAARLFRWARFVIVTKQEGQFKEQEVNP